MPPGMLPLLCAHGHPHPVLLVLIHDCWNTLWYLAVQEPSLNIVLFSLFCAVHYFAHCPPCHVSVYATCHASLHGIQDSLASVDGSVGGSFGFCLEQIESGK